jgi:MFS family permease
MFGLMIILFFDTIALVGLMVALSGEGIGFGTAAVIAGIFSVATTILGAILGAFLGIAGILLAAVIGAGILGLVISAMFGMEIKRAFAVGGAFAAVHFVVAVCVAIFFAQPARPAPQEVEFDLSSRQVIVASEIA